MNDIIDKHMRVRKLTTKEFMKSKSKDDQLQFNKVKNEITSLTRKSKQDYYKKYFDKHSKNSKKIWNGIKEIINLKQKSSSLPTSLIDNGKFLSNQKDVANHFNSYFSDIAGNILKKRKYKGKHSFQNYLKHALPNSHMFFDCDQIEVECLISMLQTSKSSGPWSIPVNVLHLL